MTFSRHDLNMGPFRIRTRGRGRGSGSHSLLVFLFHHFLTAFQLFHPHDRVVLAACPSASRAAQLVNNRRPIALATSVYFECLQSGGTLNLLLPASSFTLGSHAMTAADDISEYTKLCLTSGVQCPLGVKENMQCVHSSDAVAVTQFDLTLRIAGTYYPSLQGKIHAANHEWAYRLATVLGVPVQEVEVATIYTPLPTEIDVVEWKIRRQGIPGDTDRRELDVMREEREDMALVGAGADAEEKIEDADEDDGATVNVGIDGRTATTESQSRSRPALRGTKNKRKRENKRRAQDTQSERRFLVSFHVETTRALTDVCTGFGPTDLDWPKLLGIPTSTSVTVLNNGPQIKTWPSSVGVSLSAYTLWLQLRTQNTPYPPLHTAWQVLVQKRHTSGGVEEYANDWSYLTCNQPRLPAMLLPTTLTCEHLYPSPQSLNLNANAVETTAVQFQFSYKTKVDFGLGSSVTDRIKEALAGAIFGDKSVAADRMITLKASTEGRRSNGVNYYEAGVIAQAIMQAPGWKSYSSEVATAAIQSYCCHDANGLKLRQSFFGHLQQGLAAQDNSQFLQYQPYMDDKESNFIDFWVSAAEVRHKLKVQNLLGVCAADGSDGDSCTTDAPLESGGGGGSGSGGSSGTTDDSNLSTAEQVCANQQSHCDCASQSCQWSGSAGCVQSGGDDISCQQCPTMSQCPNAACAGFTKPCTCATSTACGWDVSTLSCKVVSVNVANAGAGGVTCDDCPSQPKCMPPFLLSATPASKTELQSPSSVDFTLLQFSEPVSLTPSVIGDSSRHPWARVWCDESTQAEVSVVADHRIHNERVFFDKVALPVDRVPNERTRACALIIDADALQDGHGLSFPGVRHEIVVLDVVTPYLSMHGPKSDENSRLDQTDPRLILVFAETVRLNPDTLLSLPYIRKYSDPDLPHFQLKLPARFFSLEGSKSVRVDLTSVMGYMEAEVPYAISIPTSLITDLAGNEFAGVPCAQIDCYGAPVLWKFALGPRIGGEEGSGEGDDAAVNEDQIVLITGLACVGITFFICLYFLARHYRRHLERNEYMRNPTIHFSSDKYLSQERRRSNVYQEADPTPEGVGGMWKNLPTKVAPEMGARSSSSQNVNGRGNNANYPFPPEEMPPGSPNQQKKMNWRAAARAAQAFERSFIITREKVGAAARAGRRASAQVGGGGGGKQAGKEGGGEQADPRLDQRQQFNRRSSAPASGASPAGAGGAPTPGERERNDRGSKKPASPSKGAQQGPSSRTGGAGAGQTPHAGGAGGTNGPSSSSHHQQQPGSSKAAGSKRETTPGNAEGTPAAGGPTSKSKRRQSTGDVPSDRDYKPSGAGGGAQAGGTQQGSKAKGDQQQKQQRRASSTDSNWYNKDQKQKEQKQQQPPTPTWKLPAHPDDPTTAKHTKEIEGILKQNAGKTSEEKKKVLRDLQLKYHPDKCEDPFAKTVFQFVQGAKPWFLQDL